MWLLPVQLPKGPCLWAQLWWEENWLPSSGVPWRRAGASRAETGESEGLGKRSARHYTLRNWQRGVRHFPLYSSEVAEGQSGRTCLCICSQASTSTQRNNPAASTQQLSQKRSTSTVVSVPPDWQGKGAPYPGIHPRSPLPRREAAHTRGTQHTLLLLPCASRVSGCWRPGTNLTAPTTQQAHHPGQMPALPFLPETLRELRLI